MFAPRLRIVSSTAGFFDVINRKCPTVNSWKEVKMEQPSL